MNDFRNLGPYVVPCASYNNIARASVCFRNYCPLGIFIYQIIPKLLKSKQYCRWIVLYILENNRDLPKPGAELKELFQMVKAYKPCNVNIMRSCISYGPPTAIEIEYGVASCQCNKPNFEVSIPSSHKWVKKEEIDVALQNLNI